MQEHFFIASDGDLFDTRIAGWYRKPLRSRYSFHCREINTVAEFKSTLRAGNWSFPGAYPMYLLCSDGGALCFDCARKEVRSIFGSIAGKSRDGWQVVACDTNLEDVELSCDHCHKQIESAYGNDGD